MDDITVMVSGASAGVGRAVARAFGRRRCRVGLIARDPKRLAQTAAEIEALGGQALALPLDVADADQVEAAAQRLEDTFGPMDAWINSAMVTTYAPVHRMKPDEFARVTQVTYLGTVHGTLAALKRMRPRNFGRIVQVGSALSYRAIPLQSAYCAAKFAVRGFTDALRTELIHDGVRGVRLTMVHLPAVNTPQFDWARNHMARRPQPVPPIFQPEPIAEAIVRATQSCPRELWVGWPTIKAIVGTMAAPAYADRRAADAWEGELDVDAEPRLADNLFAPVDGAWAAHGRFDDQSRRRVHAISEGAVRTAAVAAVAGLALGLGAAAWRGTRGKRRLLRNQQHNRRHTMADTREIMLDWLRDAHAMERASIDNLKRQVDHLEHYPDIRAKFQQQLELTKVQEDRIDKALETMGADKSSIKDAITRFAGQAQALLAGSSADEVVKQATTTLAYEEWEIANFRALAAAAQHEGEVSMASMFEQMAEEKEEMADWLADAIPDITRRYLSLRAGGADVGMAKS
ncbi:MAG TPA: SDR family oxidoreductase [Magnetospirillum sp.]|nr:SDR family oxidoreductase [Magnetospirillum sp.]